MRKQFLVIFIFITIFSGYIFAQNPSRTFRNTKFRDRNLSPIRKKPNGEQKKKLQPKPTDLNRYAEFLKQPKTGIFRLFPDPGCEEDANVIRADKPCLEAIPESSFYSFREKEHTAEYLSDIRLKDNHLISDGILMQSFFVALGDVALEKVSLATDGLKFMQDYAVNSEGAEAQKQFLQMVQGVKSGKFIYRKALPVAENTTYALRVVAFRGSIYQRFRGYRYDILDGDKRIDLTVAFRVIGKSGDGGITLLWKELERRDAPKFRRSKRQNKFLQYAK